MEGEREQEQRGLAAADLLDKTFVGCLINRCLSIAIIKRKAIPVVFIRRQDLGVVSNNNRSSGVTPADVSKEYITYI
jgi:hypothetical protein